MVWLVPPSEVLETTAESAISFFYLELHGHCRIAISVVSCVTKEIEKAFLDTELGRSKQLASHFLYEFC